jgi:hypothetical protein
MSLSQTQIDRALALCDDMLASIARLQAIADEMKAASDEFMARHQAPVTGADVFKPIFRNGGGDHA